MSVIIDYTNYRGERAKRRIQPKRTWFGATEFHPVPGWLLDAVALDRGGEVRDFRMADIHSWEEESR